MDRLKVTQNIQLSNLLHTYAVKFLEFRVIREIFSHILNSSPIGYLILTGSKTYISHQNTVAKIEMGRICPACGEENTEFIMGLCGDCYSRRNDIIKIPGVISVDLCPRCESIRHEGRWRKIDKNRFISQIIEEKARILDQIKNIRMEIDHLVEDRWVNQLKITLSGNLAGKPVEKIALTEIRFVPRVCENCSKQSGNYYEAIIQLRSERGWLYDDEINRFQSMVEDMVAEERRKDNRGAFITKWKMKKEGANVYLSTRDLGKKISRKLRNELGGKLRESRSVVGRKDGRDLYRFTFSLRLPRYKKGDIVLANRKPAIIKSYKKGIDLVSGKEVRLRGDERIIGDLSSSFKGIVVNMDRTVLEIVSDDGSIVKIRRPLFKISIGDEIDVVDTDEGRWALPRGIP